MVRTNCTDRQIDFSLWERHWIILSFTNQVQFTDRQLDPLCWRCVRFTAVRTVRTVTSISHSENESEINRPTNEMQFTDPQLFYMDRVRGSRSERTVRTVKLISPSVNECEMFWVPLMSNLRLINSSIRTGMWRLQSEGNERIDTLYSQSVTVRVLKIP